MFLNMSRNTLPDTNDYAGRPSPSTWGAFGDSLKQWQRIFWKLYDFSDEEIRRLTREALELNRRSAVFFQTKKVQNMPKLLTIHTLYEEFKNFAPALPWDDFFQAILL